MGMGEPETVVEETTVVGEVADNPVVEDGEVEVVEQTEEVEEVEEVEEDP